ncbi:MAG: hypothetical protein HC837_19710 [Chloroflexaceae bacterium]|nr:hypothetical protein [Chloroflexaceae bacterium]
MTPASEWVVEVWSISTGQRTREIARKTSIFDSVAWSPDGRLLATSDGSFDHTIRLWDAEDGRPLQTVASHQGCVYCVAWSPDGRLLASASLDRTIRIWQVTYETD